APKNPPGRITYQAPTLIGCKFLKNNFVSIASFSFAAISEGGELCGSFRMPSSAFAKKVFGPENTHFVNRERDARTAQPACTICASAQPFLTHLSPQKEKPVTLLQTQASPIS
ncbi:hypothetical protein, partial [Paraburkholderia tropica]|uniref:hypothetical protein n=3 Tax=Paraburkholderia tropica TaxID=92647 RepID=UPI002AB67DDA